MKKIGLLGCGAIGAQIAQAIDTGRIEARLTHVYDTTESRAQKLASALKSPPEVVANPHLLSSNDTDLIVEAASQQAVRDVALSVLQNRKDLVIMSPGALLDASVYKVLYDACGEFGTKIYLPSGAIAGLDAIKAVQSEVESLTLITTKPPQSFSGAPGIKDAGIDLDAVDKSTVVFDGSASDAVHKFPTNINVAALLSLAVPGHEMKVMIIADPKVTKNSHTIEARGAFGHFAINVSNLPDPANPKTSRLAVLSAIELLSRVCSSRVRIGT